MTVEAELQEAQRVLYDAMMRKDIAALSTMLHQDLIFVHSTAVVEDRETYLKAVAENLYQYRSIIAQPTLVRVYDGFAVMSGIVDMNTTLHLQVTLVWVRQDGKWVLLLRNSTRFP